MGWLDQIPRCPNLYIGGLHALLQREPLLRAANITHIVSVLDMELYPGHSDRFAAYTHLQIRIDDDPNEILLVHFAAASAFIAEAIDRGEGVFVHCAMGKSRSATIVCAFLMERFGVGVGEALEWVCEGRPVCAPNGGFMEQLEIWGVMLGKETEAEREEVFEAWKRDRFTGDWWTWEKRREGMKL